MKKSKKKTPKKAAGKAKQKIRPGKNLAAR